MRYDRIGSDCHRHAILQMNMCTLKNTLSVITDMYTIDFPAYSDFRDNRNTQLLNIITSKVYLFVLYT
jgi:hypothetical protein